MHEPILYGWRDDGSHPWYGPNNEVSVWNIARPAKSEEHPTMKPVELVERAIMNSSQRGETVLDPFGGSGSTLIACEKADRINCSVELDPQYCQVIIKRWEQYTGKIATRSDGLTLKQLIGGIKTRKKGEKQVTAVA